MYTIVAASQKGGSGKTTLSGHLAVEAARAGAGEIALIDTDPQGSPGRIGGTRARRPRRISSRRACPIWKQALADLDRAGIKIAVIDTPPAITQSISRVVAHADLVLVPTRPSPHDLRAVGATVDIAERHGKPLIFVINAATARARITGESAVALSQHGTVAPVTIHHRVDFAASMIDGRTVGEVVPGSPIGQGDQRSVALYPGPAVAHRARSQRCCPNSSPSIWRSIPCWRRREENAAAMHADAAAVEPPVL